MAHIVTHRWNRNRKPLLAIGSLGMIAGLLLRLPWLFILSAAITVIGGLTFLQTRRICSDCGNTVQSTTRQCASCGAAIAQK